MEPVQNSKSFLNIKNVLLVFIPLILLMVIWIYLNSPMLVSVTGTGNINAAATDATLSFSLTASDLTPSGAIASVQSKAEQIKSVLVSRGIAANDISKSEVTIVPSNLITAGATGFQSSISMKFKTIHVSEIDNLISTLYSNGVYVVSQPVLSVDQASDLQNQARELAIKDAGNQMSKIAAKHFKLFRKIVSISEESSTTSTTSTSDSGVIAQAENPNIPQSGMFDVVKIVNVIYKLW